MGRRIRYARNDLHGVLPVYKAAGMVSRDVIRHIEKVLGRVKMGHVGTLDPAADGVLPIVFGDATKLQDQLLGIPKSYRFRVQLGVETDSLDQDGEVTKELPVQTHLDAVKDAVQELLGRQKQVPPIFSAVKYRGTPLYTYVREGRIDQVPMEELEREVEVYSVEFLGFDEQQRSVDLEVQCSKGTYVRVLARTLANKLGTCGHVTRLTRTAASGFKISDTVSLDEIDNNIHDFSKLLVQP